MLSDCCCRAGDDVVCNVSLSLSVTYSTLTLSLIMLFYTSAGETIFNRCDGTQYTHGHTHKRSFCSAHQRITRHKWTSRDHTHPGV